MKLNKYKNTDLVKQATLVLLIKDNQILLAMKKRGFGKGRWNGVGGKPKIDESIENAAKRETMEEIGIQINAFTEVGRLSFYFSNNSDWNQKVIVYIADKWTGEPVETEEMAPKWFSIKEIPFEAMWPDDKYWLPLVLQGKKIKASFLFGEGDVVEDMEITEVFS